jgi:hypothetical protein
VIAFLESFDARSDLEDLSGGYIHSVKIAGGSRRGQGEFGGSVEGEGGRERIPCTSQTAATCWAGIGSLTFVPTATDVPHDHSVANAAVLNEKGGQLAPKSPEAV